MLVVGMVTITKRRRERWSHTKTQIQIQNKKRGLLKLIRMLVVRMTTLTKRRRELEPDKERCNTIIVNFIVIHVNFMNIILTVVVILME